MNLTKEILNKIIYTKNGREFLKDIDLEALEYFIKLNTSAIDDLQSIDLTIIPYGFHLTNDKDYSIMVLIDKILFKKGPTTYAVIEKQNNRLMNTIKDYNTKCYLVLDGHTFYYYEYENNKYLIGGSLTSLKTIIDDKEYFEYKNFNINQKNLFDQLIGVNKNGDSFYEEIFNKLVTKVKSPKKTNKRILKKTAHQFKN